MLGYHSARIKDLIHINNNLWFYVYTEVPHDFVGDTFDVLRDPEVAKKQVELQ